MERVGIVVCNYNKEDKVLICIQSILESLYEDYHIYVVDNASTDRSVEFIREKYGENKKVTLLCNTENLGGSGGFNTGLREALKKKHEYLMCVDNDAFLDEKCVGALVEFLDQTPEAGIAAAKIYHSQNPNYIQQYGSFINWKDYCVVSTYYNYPEDGTLPEVVYSDAVPACALMIRTSVVEKIGIMPEENFLYWDDTEWCYKCTLAGYKVASVGAARACHAMGAKKEETNTFPTYYAWRNWIWFFLKYLPEEQLEDMADVFLNSIFLLEYEGLYRGERNRAQTVMAALDDALHGHLGKAGPDRIFEIEKSYQRLNQILDGKNELCIKETLYSIEAAQLMAKLQRERPNLTVYLLKQDGTARIMNGEGRLEIYTGNHWKQCDTTITLCESIFQLEDLSLLTYYMDIDGNILATEDDQLMVINYAYSKRMFLFEEKPLFLRLASELRASSLSKS